MTKKYITRRGFLKLLGTTLLGLFLFPYEKFFGKMPEGKTKNMQEARYYKKTDTLAG